MEKTINTGRRLLEKIDKLISGANNKINIHANKASQHLKIKGDLLKHHKNLHKYVGKVTGQPAKLLHAHLTMLGQVQQKAHKHHKEYKLLTEKYHKHLHTFKLAKAKVTKIIRAVRSGKLSREQKVKAELAITDALQLITKLS